jgi:hypothetical protein
MCRSNGIVPYFTCILNLPQLSRFVITFQRHSPHQQSDKLHKVESASTIWARCLQWLCGACLCTVIVFVVLARIIGPIGPGFPREELAAYEREHGDGHGL